MPRLATFLFLTLLVPATASAQSSEAEPTAPAAPASGSGGVEPVYGNRSVTPAPGTFSLYVGPNSNIDLNLATGTPLFGTLLEPGLSQVIIAETEVCAFGFCTTTDIPDPLVLSIGGAYAPIENLEVGAMLLVLELAPDVEYATTTLHARYRLVEGPIDVAGQVLFVLPFGNGPFIAEVGMPVRFRGNLRVDTGGYVSFDENGNFGMRIPVALAAQLTPQFFLGGRTGFGVPDFDFGDTYIPLELIGGYTIATGSTVVDITAGAGFPAFLAFGGIYHSRYDSVITEIFQFSLGANAHF